MFGREPNLGTYISCNICGKRFWTEDGVPLCSTRCAEEEERLIEEAEEDI